MATITVTNLIENFAGACRALVPFLDTAEVPWQDHLQYDNFDRFVEPLFVSLVTEPCEFAAVGEGRAKALGTIRYGFPVERAGSAKHAYIAVRTVDGVEWPFVQLQSETTPFDIAEYDDPTGRHSIPLAQATFAFIYPSAQGRIERLELVDLQAT